MNTIYKIIKYVLAIGMLVPLAMSASCGVGGSPNCWWKQPAPTRGCTRCTLANNSINNNRNVQQTLPTSFETTRQMPIETPVRDFASSKYKYMGGDLEGDIITVNPPTPAQTLPLVNDSTAAGATQYVEADINSDEDFAPQSNLEVSDDMESVTMDAVTPTDESVYDDEIGQSE
jgi:hypothetical protein